MSGADDEKVRVEVRRSDPGAQDSFVVRRTEPMLILDLLLAIRREHDPSLAFRYSCRVAMCNVCGVLVDGEPALACQVPLRRDQEEVVVEPLGEAPVIRDLIVATDQFVDEWARDADGRAR